MELWYILGGLIVIVAAAVAINRRTQRRFLAAGGKCVACFDTGAPGPRDVHCSACGRWLHGYER